MNKDLSKYGVSIVNVGSTAFLRYANIFLRQNEPKMDIPVSLITDVDVKPIKCKPTIKESGTTRELTEVELETKRITTISDKETKYPEPIKSFIAPYWTLEYTIALSCLSKIFYQAVYICWKSKNKDYVYTKEEKQLFIENANKEYCKWLEDDRNIEEIAYKIYKETLLDKQISKAVVAQVFSQLLNEVDLILYDIHSDTKLKYLVDAIEYVTGN